MTFKKGDLLNCVRPNGMYLTKDKIYTVLADVAHGGEVSVVNDKGNTNTYDVSRFTLAARKAATMEQSFKVGDIVEITKSGYGTHPDDIGKQTTVLHILGGGKIQYSTVGLKIGTMFGGGGTYTGSAVAFRKVSLDFTKPLFTIEGTPVQLVSTNGRDEKFPVLAYEGSAKDTTKYSLTGKSKYGADRRNLTNQEPKPEPVPPVTATVYVNLFDDGTTGLFVKNSRIDADAALGSRKRVAVAKLVIVEGTFDA